MTIIEAIIMGIVQGLTEFLPVSSSGHLEIANVVLGIEAEENLAFATMVHGGTVLSTIVVFRKWIGQLLAGLFKFELNRETRFIINILISMLPILFVGMFFKDAIESLFTGNLLLVGFALIATGVLLVFSSYAKAKDRSITMKDAFIIGIAQACAVIPGLSRSGSTISTGLMLGLRRDEIAPFSFLMVIIPILGMNFLDLVGGGFGEAAASVGAWSLIAGFLTSFLVGVAACKIMINLVKRGKLIWFAVYCFVIGAAAVIYSLI